MLTFWCNCVQVRNLWGRTRGCSVRLRCLLPWVLQWSPCYYCVCEDKRESFLRPGSTLDLWPCTRRPFAEVGFLYPSSGAVACGRNWNEVCWEAEQSVLIVKLKTFYASVFRLYSLTSCISCYHVTLLKDLVYGSLLVLFFSFGC